MKTAGKRKCYGKILQFPVNVNTGYRSASEGVSLSITITQATAITAWLLTGSHHC